MTLRERYRRSITLGFLGPTLTLLAFALAGAGALLWSFIARDIETQAAKEVAAAVDRVEQSLSDCDTLLLDTIHVSMRVLVQEGEATGKPARGPMVKVGREQVPDVLLGREPQANATDLVDEVKELTQSTATIFARRGDDFVRVSTNVMAADGRRAVGTPLDRAGRAIAALRQGRAFYGMVEILGQPYVTGYEPIRDAGGEDAGKGFAVVANEVKELAKQTSQATEDISQRIEAIQGETKGAMQAIGEIAGIITQINQTSDTIASAVEEQTATTNEIGRNITEAARGANEIARSVSSVAEAAVATSQGAADTQKGSHALTQLAVQLQGLVARFAV